LGEFNQLFKQVDQDHNGVINEGEFRELIVSMNVVVANPTGTNGEIDTLLRVIDPFNNQQMTYSEVVQLLSNQLVPQQNFNQIQNHTPIPWRDNYNNNKLD
jgi:Ca2+-binding EF-hand superfamily protein